MAYELNTIVKMAICKNALVADGYLCVLRRRCFFDDHEFWNYMTYTRNSEYFLKFLENNPIGLRDLR
jgi:hypothetical protein